VTCLRSSAVPQNRGRQPAHGECVRTRPRRAAGLTRRKPLHNRQLWIFAKEPAESQGARADARGSVEGVRGLILPTRANARGSVAPLASISDVSNERRNASAGLVPAEREIVH